ncbi:MAG: hypothetical protein WCA46_25795 [Actinocatenispora sp.]
MSTKIRRGVLATVGAAAVTTALLAGATPAQATWGVPGNREPICAQTLEVRDAPGGTPFDTLTYLQSFLIEDTSGSYVYGFAYGNVNKHGWVQNGWFC